MKMELETRSKTIKEKEAKLLINENEIKAAKIDACEKTLRVCIGPTLQ